MASSPDEGVAAAHGMAYQDETVQAQGVYKAVDVCLLGLDGVVAVGSPVAVPVASLVQGQDVEPVGKGQADEVPAMGLLAPAMEHQDRWVGGVSPLQVVKIQPVDLDVPVGGYILLGEGDTHLARRLVEGHNLCSLGSRRHIPSPVQFLGHHNAAVNAAIGRWAGP